MYTRRQDRVPSIMIPASSDLSTWADVLTRPSNRFICLKHVDLARRELAVLLIDTIADLSSYIVSASEHMALQQQMLFRAFFGSLLSQTPQLIPYAVSLSIKHDFTSTILDPYGECDGIFMDSLALELLTQAEDATSSTHHLFTPCWVSPASSYTIRSNPRSRRNSDPLPISPHTRLSNDVSFQLSPAIDSIARDLQLFSSHRTSDTDLKTDPDDDDDVHYDEGDDLNDIYD